MKFGLTPLADASGAILAHGTGGLKKGHVLTPSDIATLRAQGISEAMTAALESGDIHEDEAARRIAEALAGSGITQAAPHTGRSNLHATAPGLVMLEPAAIDRINRLHESITLATLRPFDSVEANQMVATVKIIPFASPDWAVASAVEIASRARLRTAPFLRKRAALVSTTTPGFRDTLHDKTRKVIDQRLARIGSHLISEHRAPHETAALAAALDAALEQAPDIVLVMGASATTDRADTVPMAIEAAGGTVFHLGMPVDPGNLLLLGAIGHAHVIGVPGCARSPKLNGLDWVLQRLCADIPVTPADIQAMGVGGLLQEIASRPQRREATAEPPGSPRVVALLLAAGRSTRMQGHNKLVLPIAGTPLVAHAANALTQSRVAHVIAVTGHDREAVEHALANKNLAFVHNPDHATGMAGSLKAGLAQVPDDADAVLVCLGDMPAIRPAHIDSLLSAFNPGAGRAIVVPVFGGKRGNPVLLARHFFPEIMRCEGDTGARQVIAANPDSVFEVEMDSAAILADADTPAAFQALKAELDPT